MVFLPYTLSHTQEPSLGIAIVAKNKTKQKKPRLE